MPKNSRQEALKAFDKLLDVMNELREKCPWDREQTFDSIRKLTIEEAYELSEAIIEKDFDKIKKELGDLLLHVVFYAKMGDEQEKFDIKDVIDTLVEKLIFRHPHVFGDVQVSDAKEVKENWEKLKLKEKDSNKKLLSGVPKSLPACIKAFRVSEKVASVGFEWDKKEDVWTKVDEELNELKQAIKNNDPENIEEEFGDVFFVLINAARLYGIDPEAALSKTVSKFINRFNYIEDKVKELYNGDWDKTDLKEMDKFWLEYKQKEKNNET